MILLSYDPRPLADDGKLVSAENVTKDHLSSDYDTESENAVTLLSVLNVSDPVSDELEDNSNLTETQRGKIAFADKLREYGIESEDDLVEFQEFRRRKAEAQKANERASNRAENT